MLVAPLPLSMAVSIRRSARRPPGSADAGGMGQQPSGAKDAARACRA
jgi:hypothetical protein